MSNQLVTLDSKNELSIFLNEIETLKVVKEIKCKVMSLDGGDIKTTIGRKKIKSNAFLVAKSKTFLNERIDFHIKITKDGIHKELNIIKTLEKTKKSLDAHLTGIRKDAIKEVAEYEKKEKEQKEKDEAYLVHDDAIRENKIKDRELFVEKELIRIKNEEIERKQKERDDNIKNQAILDAKLKLEKDAINALEKIKKEKEAAIKEKEAAIKEKEDALKEKEVAVKASVIAEKAISDANIEKIKKEKEAAIKEKEAAIKEKDAAEAKEKIKKLEEEKSLKALDVKPNMCLDDVDDLFGNCSEENELIESAKKSIKNALINECSLTPDDAERVMEYIVSNKHVNIKFSVL